MICGTSGFLLPRRWLLLGDATNPLQGFGDRFKPDGDAPARAYQQLEALAYLLAIVVITIAVVWGFAAWRHARQHREYKSARRLFRELARAHGLTLAEQQLLREIAAWHNMPIPALLFVEPRRFQSSALTETIGRPDAIADLASKLFDDEP